jgi:hypothetical protein
LADGAGLAQTKVFEDPYEAKMKALKVVACSCLRPRPVML